MVKVTRDVGIARWRRSGSGSRRTTTPCSASRRASTDKEIARAYQKLAKQYHPDANPGDKDAEERFKEISAAYDVLGDAEKRKEYDEVRRMVASGVGPGGVGGFGPGGFGGGRRSASTTAATAAGSSPTSSAACSAGGGGRRRAPRRRRRVRSAARISRPSCTSSFDDAVHGVTSTVRFRADAACSHVSAAPAPRPARRRRRARSATARGSIAVDQGPFSFSQVCPTCGGRGQVIPTPCPHVQGPRRRGARPRGEGARSRPASPTASASA